MHDHHHPDCAPANRSLAVRPRTHDRFGPFTQEEVDYFADWYLQRNGTHDRSVTVGGPQLMAVEVWRDGDGAYYRISMEWPDTGFSQNLVRQSAPYASLLEVVSAAADRLGRWLVDETGTRMLLGFYVKGEDEDLTVAAKHTGMAPHELRECMRGERELTTAARCRIAAHMGLRYDSELAMWVFSGPVPADPEVADNHGRKSEGSVQ